MTVIDLGGLGARGLAIRGAGNYAQLGFDVASAGDVNNDGVDDFLLSAAYSANGYGPGGVYLIFGKAGGLGSLDLANLAASDGVFFRGEGNSYQSYLTGEEISSAGDINGDGYDDILIGAPRFGNYAGKTYVLFGKAGGFTNLDLGSLAPADGFTLTHNISESWSGQSLSAAGDINNDGYGDFLVGSAKHRAYVILGKADGFAAMALNPFDRANGFIVQGNGTSDTVGGAVAGLGDFNGDGIDDFAIGAYSSNVVYVLFGKAGFSADVDVRTLTAADGFVIPGGHAQDFLGYIMSRAGDVNGDGLEDMILGTNNGKAYVVFGRPGGAASIDLNNLGTGGFIIQSASISFSGAAAAGDVNGDGFDDVIVGAPLDYRGGSNAGGAFIVYGKANASGTVNADALADADGYFLQGEDQGDDAGRDVSSAGDVNGDGFDDVLVGASRNDTSPAFAVGAAYLVFGEMPVGDVVRIGTVAGQTLAGGLGNDSLDGQGGADRLFGNDGNDLLDGGTGSDILRGGAGVDTLYGGDGDDAIDGGDGDDTLRGDAGDDVLIGGAGDDDYAGGDGTDTLDFSGEAGSVTVNLSTNSGLFSNSPLATRPLNPGEAFDSFGNYEAVSGIENLILTAGDDFVLGGDSANRFEGGAGDDILLGQGGNDVLLGAAGLDVLSGGLGADWIEGGDADDELDGGAGDDRLDGGAGNDTALYSQAGAGVTVDLTLLGVAQDTGGAGIDTLFDIENLSGSSFSDILIGNDLANVLTGLGGGDTMRGGGGDDTYFVRGAADTVEESAGQGVDTVRSFLAVYSLLALPNVENLGPAGSAAPRDFRGNAANNVVSGGSRNDVLRLYDGGDDTANGGGGDDAIFFGATLTAADVVNGGAGTDTLVLQGSYAGGLTLGANVTLIENVSILAGSNTNFGESGSNRYDYVLTTSDANFAAGVQARINGAALLEGEDFTFDGSAETDAKFVVYGGKGKDTLTGGLGNDIFFYAEERFATGDTVNGGAGYDGMFLRGNYTIDFNAPGYTGLFTNIENLTLTSATDERYARGGGTEFDYNLTLSNAIVKPGETLTVSGALLMASETMILDASQESDGVLRLFGGKANDTLKGGALADLIHGNLGADILTGNGGADTFRYDSTAESSSGSMDQVLDFTPGTDKIDLSRIDANGAVAGDQAFGWIGSSAFSGVAGQLRAYEQSGTWFVEGDTDGDSVADLVIALTLQGPTPLGAGDFLL